MKCIYGSQNFGYNNENSDKDYMEIVTPGWNDILNECNKHSNYEVKSNSGIVKVRDIRKHAKLLLVGHFNDLQTLYTVEKTDSGNFEWFISNRQRIVENIKYKIYKTNSISARDQMLKMIDAKCITRLYVYNILLKRLLTENKFKLMCEDSKSYREWAESIDKFEMCKEAKRLIYSINNMQLDFDQFKDADNTQLINDINDEITRLIFNKLKKEYKVDGGQNNGK